MVFGTSLFVLGLQMSRDQPKPLAQKANSLFEPEELKQKLANWAEKIKSEKKDEKEEDEEAFAQNILKKKNDQIWDDRTPDSGGGSPVPSAPLADNKPPVTVPQQPFRPALQPQHLAQHQSGSTPVAQASSNALLTGSRLRSGNPAQPLRSGMGKFS